MKRKILVIEDDKAIAQLIHDYMEIDGMETLIETNGRSGLETALAGGFDLVILDIMLPGIDGFEICKRIRKESEVPVIMLSARREDIDKIRGLGLGADDYIAKPFSPGELVARVKAHINRFERLTNPREYERTIAVRGIEIESASHTARIHGKEVQLTGKEFDILYLFVSNPGRVYTKEDIFEHIWGADTAGDTSTVTVHIRKLREKIEEDPSEPRYIETVWGIGYRFRA